MAEKFDESLLAKNEETLKQSEYLSQQNLPNDKDAEFFLALQKKNWLQDYEKYPNISSWYNWISMFDQKVISSWQGENKKQDKKNQQQQQQQQQQGAEEQKKPDDDIDLFGNEPTEEEKEKYRQECLQKSLDKQKKKGVVAKTNFFFNVKVYETDQDLDALAQKIFQNVKFESLIWYTKPEMIKKLDVAYGIKMLQVACILEDDKCSSDDIIEKIDKLYGDVEGGGTGEVQSVDVAGLQKV